MKRRENIRKNRTVGKQFEQAAANYLTEQGYQILERNFYCRQGEIDLIAKEGAYLVFIEVKYRKTAAFGEPIEAVDWRKQERLYRAAEYYLYHFGYKKEQLCRFDVVGILGEKMTLVRNAFGGL